MRYIAHGIPLDFIPWAHECLPLENIKIKLCMHEVHPSLMRGAAGSSPPPLCATRPRAHRLLRDPPPPGTTYLLIFSQVVGTPPLTQCGRKQKVAETVNIVAHRQAHRTQKLWIRCEGCEVHCSMLPQQRL